MADNKKEAAFPATDTDTKSATAPLVTFKPSVVTGAHVAAIPPTVNATNGVPAPNATFTPIDSFGTMWTVLPLHVSFLYHSELSVATLSESLRGVISTPFRSWGGRVHRYSGIVTDAAGAIGDRLLVITHSEPSVTVYHGRYEGKEPLILDLTKVAPGSVEELQQLSGPQLAALQPDTFAASRTASSATPLLQITITHIPAQTQPSASSSAASAPAAPWWTLLTVAVNHGVTDADALFRFMECWTSYTKKGSWDNHTVVATDRFIWPLPAEHKGVTWERARQLGQVAGGLRGRPPSDLAYRAPIITKAQIDALKAAARHGRASEALKDRVVSTNDVLTAQHWRLYAAMTTHIEPTTVMTLCIVFNFRKQKWWPTLVTPAVDGERYIGPVVSHCLVEATRAQLLEWDLSQVVDLVRRTVDGYGAEQARECIRYLNEAQYGADKPGLNPTFKLGNIGGPLDFTNGYFVTNWCNNNVFTRCDFGASSGSHGGRLVDFTNGGGVGMVVTIAKETATSGDVMWQEVLPRSMCALLSRTRDHGAHPDATDDLRKLMT